LTINRSIEAHYASIEGKSFMKTLQKFALNSAQCCRISLIPEQDALSVVGTRVKPI
jgi:hypothetical protein